MFFDNLLVYSPDLETHVKHLDNILLLLRSHTLYAKRSKCSFEQYKVEYLGNIISYEGVSVDPNKIVVMVNWSIPTSIKALKVFLVLLAITAAL